jgi:hypothetical protein
MIELLIDVGIVWYLTLGLIAWALCRMSALPQEDRW